MDITIYPKSVTNFAASCAIIFSVVGVGGNFLTILALTRCPKLRAHATTAFILSLSVSDMIFCLINLPLTATRYIERAWTLGETLCKIFPVLFYGNVTVSVLNMVAITINRYVLISYTTIYTRLYTYRSIWVQLVLIWAISFLIMLPPLLGVWGQLGLDMETFSCTILEKNGSSPKTSIFLVGFGLPCLVIIVCYACIFYSVKKSRKKLEAHMTMTTTTQRDRRNLKRDKDDRRLTKLMLIIFICFLLSFLPLMIANVFDKDTKIPTLHVVASILAWMSSVINPFIYAVSNRQYREAYGKLFNLFKSNVVNYSESRPYTQSRPSVSDVHVALNGSKNT